MSALQITSVLIRLFAIWCGLDAVSWLLSFWDPAQYGDYKNPFTLAYILIYLVAAVVLWVFPTLIARRILLPGTTPSPTPTDAKLILNVAVVAAGLLALAIGLPTVLSAALVVYESLKAEFLPSSERTSLILRTAAAALQPMFGLILLIKAPAITRLLWSRVTEGRAGDA